MGIKDTYDHHAAIYFLLLDRLKEQKNNIGKGQADTKKRRPSTVAEQPMKGMPGAEDFQSLRLRTTSETEREACRDWSSQACRDWSSEKKPEQTEMLNTAGVREALPTHWCSSHATTRLRLFISTNRGGRA